MLSYILQHFRAVYYFHAVKLSNGTKQGAKNGAFFLAEKNMIDSILLLSVQSWKADIAVAG